MECTLLLSCIVIPVVVQLEVPAAGPYILVAVVDMVSVALVPGADARLTKEPERWF